MTTATQEIIEVKAISTTSAKEFNDKALTFSSQVKGLNIRSQAEYEQAASLLSQIKGLSKVSEDTRKKITTPLDQAKAAVMELFRPTATALTNLETHLKSLMIAYSNEQEKLRKAEQDRLDKIAKAEEDKKKKALEARAVKAAEKGNDEKAEELRQQAEEVFVPAPTIAPTVQKVAGVSMKQNWKARVIDINKVPREYMIVNESMLDKMAKATKGSLGIPGVQFYPEDVLASR